MSQFKSKASVKTRTKSLDLEGISKVLLYAISLIWCQMSKFGKMINTSNKLSNHIAFTVALLPKYSIWQYIISFAWHLPSKFYQEFYLSAPNFKTMWH